jgi:hypothetical protein
MTTLLSKKFGKWTVLNYAYRKASHNYWRCKCECGSIKNIREDSLLNKGTQSCGCVVKLQRGESSLNTLIYRYKKHAQERNLEWNLTKEESRNLFQSKCNYCGVEPSTVTRMYRRNGNYIYNGIDRVDNESGYIIDNVVPCCSICNRMKLTLSKNSFLNHIKRIFTHSCDEQRL